MSSNTGNTGLMLRNDPDAVEQLRREVRHQQLRINQLQAELSEMHGRSESDVREKDAALASLRAVQHQLLPFYHAMQHLFGDFAEAGIGTDPNAPAGHNDRTVAIWDSWKDKLGRDSACGRIIEALLHHEEMTVAQLRVACKIGQQTVYDATTRMAKLGLIDRGKGRYRLRKL